MISNTQATVNPNGINQNDRNNNAKNIYQLFSNLTQIRIPPYQCAYSWEGRWYINKNEGNISPLSVFSRQIFSIIRKFATAKNLTFPG